MSLCRKNCGLLIIGNEILSGRTVDTNSNFFCSELTKYGNDVKEIAVVSDEKKEIVKKVREFSDKYDYVFTSGGIGPTHDDITNDSLATAFKRKLTYNKKAKELLSKHYEGNELTKARLKMSLLPENVVLINNPVSIAPGYIIENVHVFPGVPSILKVMLIEFLNFRFKKNIKPQKTISTSLPEGVIGEFIEKIQLQNKKVDIGSYPYFKNNNFGVSLIIRSEDSFLLNTVCDEIIQYLCLNDGNPKIF
tara:strand:+ start:44 stop:790 length:747 start_codon:yes stop_codon:yes gene_type:complete